MDEKLLFDTIINWMKKHYLLSAGAFPALGVILAAFYFIDIKFYPSGISAADSVFFLLVAGVFTLLYSLWVMILFVASDFWNRVFGLIIGKRIPGYENKVKTFSGTDYTDWLYIAISVFISIILISIFKDAARYLPYVLYCTIAMIAYRYILIHYSINLPSSKNLAYRTGVVTGASKRKEVSYNPIIFLFLLFYFTPMIIGYGFVGGINRATFYAIGIKQESVDIVVEPKGIENLLNLYVNDNEDAKFFSSRISCNQECMIRDATILFTGVGSNTKIELKEDGRVLSAVIPNKSILLITKLEANKKKS